jgi:hypothetical protein
MRIETENDTFPGWVEIPDNFLWQETIDFLGLNRAIAGQEPEQAFYLMIPGVIRLVKEWHIAGWPEKPVIPSDIPYAPITDVIVILGRIYQALNGKFIESQSVPLVSPPTL